MPDWLPFFRRDSQTSRPTVHAELWRFFETDASALPIVTRSFSSVDLPNLERAIQRYRDANGAQIRVVGYTSEHGMFQNDIRYLIGNDAQVSSPQYREVDTDLDQRLLCVENGIHLIDSAEGRIAAHVRIDLMRRGAIDLEVIAQSSQSATNFLEAVRVQIEEANVYRGKILSLECAADLPGRFGHSHIRFHALPQIDRKNLILPDATLEMLERNTVRFFEHADTLRRSGRSLKRGLLLHGKPGTGKTYTAKWLARSLKGVTTILISGDQLNLVKECCQLARLLAPALVILEDVDLIAGERDEHRHPAYQITLHQLMNEMDGLSDNTEVLFLLTTNRPEAIEPAIAARPGRVDQAIEFPLPDAGCRRRLLALYGRGLNIEVDALEPVIARTEGASPAFIQELVRKAALIAAEDGAERDGVLHVSAAHFDTALREMVYGGGALTRQLLGFAPSE